MAGPVGHPEVYRHPRRPAGEHDRHHRPAAVARGPADATVRHRGSPEVELRRGGVTPLDVEDVIEKCAKKWKVRMIVADPYGWGRSLQVLESRGLPVEDFPQSDSRMMPATEKLIDAVTARLLEHDHDPRLAAHLKNAKTKETSRGIRLVKQFKMSSKKIDLAITAVMAYDKATQLRDGVPEPQGVGVATYAEFAAKFTPEQVQEKAKARQATISEILERAKKKQDEQVAAILAKAKAKQ